MKNLWNFIKEFSWPFGLCGGIYSILMRFIPEDKSINEWIAAAILATMIAIIITLLGYLLRQVPRASHEMLQIEQVLSNGSLILVKKNDVLGVNMGAHLYIKEGKYERMIGQAFVETVQTDGIVQLKVNYLDGLEAPLKQKIAQNIESAKSNIIIRAGVIMQSNQYLIAED